MPLYVFSYIKHTTIQYQAKFNNGNLNEIGGETTYITPLEIALTQSQLFYVGYNAIWNFSVVIYFISFCM